MTIRNDPETRRLHHSCHWTIPSHRESPFLFMFVVIPSSRIFPRRSFSLSARSLHRNRPSRHYRSHDPSIPSSPPPSSSCPQEPETPLAGPSRSFPLLASRPMKLHTRQTKKWMRKRTSLCNRAVLPALKSFNSSPLRLVLQGGPTTDE
ncbi:hypothetical protein EX30DRAFT_177142 [Ascodesmis nigricans]|uniref:Uncharacterized protein n=1 Tax=Ascodesmis nigricans TaxID=341454 RepID=A0A4S2MLH5_9PEZI|nr:hypothetical protein EX30DRAFT_177142 [Ascodesmis nigricans]